MNTPFRFAGVLLLILAISVVAAPPTLAATHDRDGPQLAAGVAVPSLDTISPDPVLVAVDPLDVMSKRQSLIALHGVQVRMHKPGVGVHRAAVPSCRVSVCAAGRPARLDRAWFT